MKIKTFYSNKYGHENTLSVGQKVICTYYHEHEMEGDNDCYKRPLYQKLVDSPFSPVKFGIIVGYAGVHSYWLGKDSKEQYLFVKFKEYFFKKAIPISCIQDAAQYAERTERFLKGDEHRLGEKGYSYESYYGLKNQAEKARQFTK